MTSNMLTCQGSVSHTVNMVLSALIDILSKPNVLKAGQLHEQAHGLTQQVAGLLAGLAVGLASLLLIRILAEVGADALVPVPVVCRQTRRYVHHGLMVILKYHLLC